MDWYKNSKEQPMYKVIRKKKIFASTILESKTAPGKCATTTLTEGTPFWNAQDTSGDTIEYQGKEMPFISFWEKATGQSQGDINFLCANAQCPYGEDINKYDLDGAHIILKRPTGAVKPGERLGILPLCPKCNNAENKDVMTLRYDIKVPIIIWKGAKS